MNYIKKIHKHTDILLLILIIVAFIIYRIPLLHLPYYWDEAWSYKPAIEEMVNNGASLLPNSISVEHYKGHPLFFYFIVSLFLKIFGNNILISKIFALLVSILVLTSTFFLTKHFTKSKISSVFSVILLSTQSIFIAQSTLVLPEMLLTLLSLLSLLFYFKKKKILFIIFTSLLLLTKETGIVLYGSILFVNLIFNLKFIKTNFKNYILTNMYLLLPVIPVLTFFFLQKTIIGWFFYPEHIGYIDFGEAFLKKFEGYISYLFIYQGRNMILTTTLFVSLFILIKKKKIKKKNELITLAVFILFYISFSSLNFYATRYILSLIPIFIIISVYLVNKSMKQDLLKSIFFTIMILSSVYYSITHKKDNDHTNGYENAISVQQKMINYCESNNYYDKNIATHFLMKVNLTDSIMGYLKSSKTFSNINNKIDNKTELVIISSNEQNKNIEDYIDEKNSDLIKEFKKEQSWCRIYKLIKTQTKNKKVL